MRDMDEGQTCFHGEHDQKQEINESVRSSILRKLKLDQGRRQTISYLRNKCENK